MMLPWQRRPKDINSPRDLPNLALWLDAKDVSSLRNNAGSEPVTTDGIKLASDKSGNSSTNVLCLNGVAGNYASSPDSAAISITGDIDLRAYVSLTDWTPAAANYIIGKWNVAGQRSYRFYVAIGGALGLLTSADGTANSSNDVSTVANSFTDLQPGWIRVTRASASGQCIFYTGGTGTTPTWVQLGATVAGTAGAIFNGTDVLEIGSIVGGTTTLMTGNVFQIQIYNGIAGTLAFDANFALPAKLATSFTESSSNAATVTINTSGGAGARISGARDLYHGTAANQPILTIAAAGNYLTFDGYNDHLKAAAFALAQPETVYFVGSQVTWTLDRYIFDGHVLNSMALYQGATTPRIRMYAGLDATENAGLAVATTGVVSAVFNNTTPSLRVNRGTAVAGTVGAGNANGFTLGTHGSGVSGSNITAQEVVVYSGAHDKATQERVIAMLARNNRIALT